MGSGKTSIVSGIYAIVCIASGHKYIGQAMDIRKRWQLHRGLLERGTHFNQYLQNAYNCHGKANFTYTLIEQLNNPTRSDLNEREQYWIIKLKPEYNLTGFIGDELNEYHFKYAAENDDVVVLKSWQKFKPPDWHAWVYGGARNPLMSAGRPASKMPPKAAK